MLTFSQSPSVWPETGTIVIKVDVRLSITEDFAYTVDVPIDVIDCETAVGIDPRICPVNSCIDPGIISFSNPENLILDSASGVALGTSFTNDFSVYPESP